METSGQPAYLSLFVWCRAVQTAVLIISPETVVFQNVQHTCHLTEDQHPGICQQGQHKNSEFIYMYKHFENILTLIYCVRFPQSKAINLAHPRIMLHFLNRVRLTACCTSQSTEGKKPCFKLLMRFLIKKVAWCKSALIVLCKNF